MADLNAFTDADTRRIATVVKQVESNPPSARIPQRRSVGSQAPTSKIFAKITGWEIITTDIPKWRYAGSQVALQDDDTWVVIDTADSGLEWTLPAQPPPDPVPPPNYLINITEANNITQNPLTGTQGNSVDQSRASYPAPFTVQPVGGGSAGVPGNEVIVTVFTTIDSAKNTRWVFEYVNSDDGLCT